MAHPMQTKQASPQTSNYSMATNGHYHGNYQENYQDAAKIHPIQNHQNLHFAQSAGNQGLILFGIFIFYFKSRVALRS